MMDEEYLYRNPMQYDTNLRYSHHYPKAQSSECSKCFALCLFIWVTVMIAIALIVFSPM